MFRSFHYDYFGGPRRIGLVIGNQTPTEHIGLLQILSLLVTSHFALFDAESVNCFAAIVYRVKAPITAVLFLAQL